MRGLFPVLVFTALAIPFTAGCGGSSGPATGSTGTGTCGRCSGASASSTSAGGSSGGSGVGTTSGGSPSSGGLHGSTSGGSTGGGTSSGSAGSTSSGSASTGGTTGTSGPSLPCAPCIEDTNCSSGQICVVDNLDSNEDFCAPNCGNGQACAAGDSCQTEYWLGQQRNAQVCYPTSGTCSTCSLVDGVCSTNPDCCGYPGGGVTCVNGRCTTPPPFGSFCGGCNTNSDCGSQGYCSTAIRACAPACQSNADCPSGTLCAEAQMIIDQTDFGLGNMCLPISENCDGLGVFCSADAGAAPGASCTEASGCRCPLTCVGLYLLGGSVSDVGSGLDGPPICLGSCASNADCGDAGQCDPDAGLCLQAN